METSKLLPNQKLAVGDRLVSDNGLYWVAQQEDGNLVLYRGQERQLLWESGQAGKPVTRTTMQEDGNLVSCSSDGRPFWATGTWNHKGASAVMQDDGNLVVYDAGGHPLWASRTDQPENSPTIHSRDARGFEFTENAPWWKELCTRFPCFLALQWPGYATTKFETKIDGMDVVIQPWKGWCPKFLGLSAFPGGVGLEVGVYRRMPGRELPSSLPFLPPILEATVLGALKVTAEQDLWWPVPDHEWTIEASFINPITGDTAFEASAEKTWWLTKWMTDASSLEFDKQQAGCDWPWLWFRRTPWPADGYKLKFKVSGSVDSREFEW